MKSAGDTIVAVVEDLAAARIGSTTNQYAEIDPEIDRVGRRLAHHAASAGRRAAGRISRSPRLIPDATPATMATSWPILFDREASARRHPHATRRSK